MASWCGPTLDGCHSRHRNGSRSAGRQPRPVTFVPPAETSKGRLPPLTWEPVSGIEPLTCRLQEIRPRAPCALAARMARVIALTAPTALGLFCASSHEPSHADGGQESVIVTERSGQEPPRRCCDLPWSDRTVNVVCQCRCTAESGHRRRPRINTAHMARGGEPRMAAILAVHGPARG